MKKILTLNKISPIGLSRFDANSYVCGEVEQPDAVIVRSASMHDMEIPASVVAIARAGAGTNNIPIDKCSEQGIVVFNTPGANANAVKELVICGLFLSSRKIVQGAIWAQTLKGKGDEVGKLVEKGKSNFAGTEILGKTLGLIGLGAIGRKVAEAAAALGMKVIGYDSFLPEGTEIAGVEIVKTIEEIYQNSDYISLHIPLNDSTKGMVDAAALAACKDGVKILNFARGGIVDSTALIPALESGKVSAYVIDFPDDSILGVEGVIAIPHLGASSAESEENCAAMAADQLIDYIETGSIKNSVNMSPVALEKGAKTCVFCKESAAAAVRNAGKVLGEAAKGGYCYIALEGTVDIAGDGILKVRVL
ncbi:MAG: 3-phosphoglycerate dehydrogenase [Clostridia bacterium]|nr:3-phosphoglycerate dehydrogenase [Clostridia bacterium]